MMAAASIGESLCFLLFVSFGLEAGGHGFPEIQRRGHHRFRQFAAHDGLDSLGVRTSSHISATTAFSSASTRGRTFLSLEDLHNLRNVLEHLRVDVDGGAPRDRENRITS
jgi:hypothetical protein